MKTLNVARQQGVVLIITLVMLMVLTFLAVSNMRGVVLETRVTANRAESQRLLDLANAALREGEFRFYGTAYLQDKLEPNISKNCIKRNKLNRNGINRPCLLSAMNQNDTNQYFSAPISFLSEANAYTEQYTKRTAEDIINARTDDVVAWMPYRGLDPNEKHYFQSSGNRNAFWNAYRPPGAAAQNESFNPQYGDAFEGRGTFFFLISAQVNDETAVQSTIAVTYSGLNN